MGLQIFELKERNKNNDENQFYLSTKFFSVDTFVARLTSELDLYLLLFFLSLETG